MRGRWSLIRPSSRRWGRTTAVGQGDVADTQRGRPADHHALLDQPRHHRSEVRADLSAGGTGDLFPYRLTDAFQGPNMANYYADVLKVPNVFVLDNCGRTASASRIRSRRRRRRRASRCWAGSA